ncbi:sodium-coupled neutral amino acid transporter 2-like protein [Carex littledalei]|uniref:Sodium-coupled neutral amino acid transporter 2-like protein n=1 Tax=Carex littledalei TaxID=544730 RepID=A0A833VQX3_9POAL|nr:sodium-coupled neutral amino acid transporter 2-like protein [Carex littledalei]
MTMGSTNPVEKRGNRKNKQIVEERTPLLPTKNEDGEGGYDEFDGASFAGAVFNLSTTVVGAGIMALPATMKVLGLVPGLLMIVFGAILTESSIDLLIKFSRVCKAVSYGEVMGDTFGKVGKSLLQVCVVVNNVGVMIVYMIIIGDVLSGTSASGVHHFGVLEGWFGSHWWNSRFVILLVTTLCVFTPLACFKRVDSLRYTSAISVALAVVFVVITAGIAIVKLISGGISMPKLFPEVTDLNSVWNLFTAVPVLVTAYICHYNVHTIDNELDDSSQIKPIVRTSLLLCSTVYITTSFFGFLLFGENTLDDVLANFDSNLGIPYSSILDDAVRVSYTIHLMLVFPIIFHALRLNLDGLVFPSGRPLSGDNRRFAGITAALLLVIFLAANFIPSIWDAFQFTGATAAVCIAFIFPAAITLKDRHGIASKKDKILSVFMIVLAVLSNAIAVYSDARSLFTKSDDSQN